MNRMQLFTATVFALCALAATGRAWAHGDEDHSQDKKPAVATAKVSIEAASALRLPDGSLFVPKAVQRQLGLRTQLAEVAEQAASLELNGTVVADPNAGGRVQSSQAGRIEPGPRGLPTLGQKVAKGQVLAYLRPVTDSMVRGNQQVQLAELESRLAIAERKARRYEQLEGAVPQKEIEAARFELEALQKSRAAVGASLNAREALTAPVSGVISAASVVAGQVVEARDILFEVVDPARLAVLALAYDAAAVDAIGAASAQFPGGTLQLEFVGGGRQLREQALPLLFRIKSPGAAVAVGQPLKVIAKTAHKTSGVALPLAALVRDKAGETVVWIHAGAEQFVPRKVRHQPLDAATAVVTSGIRGGERIVTEGAGLLAQVR